MKGSDGARREREHLRDNRSQRLDPVLLRYGGHLVKLAGDGVLTEFPRAVDVSCVRFEIEIHAIKSREIDVGLRIAFDGDGASKRHKQRPILPIDPQARHHAAPVPTEPRSAEAGWR